MTNALQDFGKTYLDVSNGMEHEKENQRRDATFARSEKRADMQDKLSQYAVDDATQAQGDRAARRTAAAGAPTLDAAAQAEQGASLARGDTTGATAAGKERLNALINDFQTTDAVFAKSQQPTQQKIAATSLAGQAGRQGGAEEVANQGQDASLQQAKEKSLARIWQIAQFDKGAALDLLSNSQHIFPGKKATDIMVSKDGQRVAIVGEDGQPLTILNKPFLDNLATRYGEPTKYQTVKADETLVRETPSGGAVPVYQGPSKPVPGRFTQNATGQVIDSHTGRVTSAAIPKPADFSKRDARVKTADGIVKEALGGSLNMGLPGEDAQRIYPQIMQRVGQKIDAGVPPEKAAHDAMDEIKRAGKLGGMAGATDPAATASKDAAVNWRDFQ